MNAENSFPAYRGEHGVLAGMGGYWVNPETGEVVAGIERVRNRRQRRTVREPGAWAILG